MTQAYNLSQLANKVNTSGQLDVSTGVTGTIPNANLPIVSVAKGGTGTATPSLVAGTGISITGSFPNQTVTSTVTGGVTSLNGQTGAITNTGFGDIGSYVIASSTSFANNTRYNGGETFAGSSLVRDNTAGGSSTATASLSGSASTSNPPTVLATYTADSVSMGLSGTWRVMCGVQNGNIGSIARRATALFVRIS